MDTDCNSKAHLCEVVGWLFDDDAARVLVREQDGQLSLQALNAQSTFAHQAIQTGSFRRGNPIFDPVTHAKIGYEMEQLPSAVAPLA